MKHNFMFPNIFMLANECNSVHLLPSRLGGVFLVGGEEKVFVLVPPASPAWLLAVWTRCVPRPAGSVANRASFLMAVLTRGNVMTGNWAGDGSHEVTRTIFCPDIYQKLSVSPQGEAV